MEELIEKVRIWAETKGIYDSSTAIAQLNGAIGELYEFREAVIKGKPEREIKTELGDVLVFLINMFTIDNIRVKAIASTFIDAQTSEAIEKDLEFEQYIKFAAHYFTRWEVYTGLAYVAHYYDLEECLQLAYDKISKRTGEMRNGKFCKDE
jgi:NTP pyrophosphatase (non-canonical NTP hydrolase)